MKIIKSKKIKAKKPVFLYGLGDKKSSYKSLDRYFVMPKIDWNTDKITPKLGKNIETLIGFSFGGTLACMHTLKHKVKNLILCSLTPGAETLAGVNAGQVIFMVGEKEKWVLKEVERMRKTLKCKNSVVVVPGASHKIDSTYKQKIIEVINKFS